MLTGVFILVSKLIAISFTDWLFKGDMSFRVSPASLRKFISLNF